MTNFEIYTYLKAKKGGGEPVPVPVTNPALRLMDWEGTVLKEYTAEQVASLTALPTPSSLNTNVDRDLLSFQGYNWALADIKSWVSAHEGQCLTVGAIYTTTDGQDHIYRNNPRIDISESVSMLKKGTTSIGASAFYSCYSLTSINIPDSVTSIGASAFGGCRSLTNVNIPDSVTSIGDRAFGGCYSLTSVNIPDSVTSISGNVFYSCYSLTSINIPDGVTSIGNSAFSGCSCLTDIVIKGDPNLANVNAFDSTYDGLRIYVPREYLSWYSTATNWDVFYDDEVIVAIEDYIEYLTSIGIDVSEYEEEQI